MFIHHHPPCVGSSSSCGCRRVSGSPGPVPPFYLFFFQTNAGSGGGSSWARSFPTFRISSCPGAAIPCDCLMPAACLAFFLSFSSSSSARSVDRSCLLFQSMLASYGPSCRFSLAPRSQTVPTPLFAAGGPLLFSSPPTCVPLGAGEGIPS